MTYSYGVDAVAVVVVKCKLPNERNWVCESFLLPGRRYFGSSSSERKKYFQILNSGKCLTSDSPA